MFAVRCVLVGERDQMTSASDAAGVSGLEVDPLCMWDSAGNVLSSALGKAQLLFIGGAWLDEDVLVVALQAAGLGYDVRLLADLSVSRPGEDHPLVHPRLALHGIVVTTVRQVALEWAVASGDQLAIRRIQKLLNDSRPGGLS